MNNASKSDVVRWETVAGGRCLGRDRGAVVSRYSSANVTDMIANVRFVTPPENQGQIVLVSYGCDSDYIYERTYDQSDRTTVIRLYEHPETDEEWGPQNGVPDLGNLVTRVEMDEVES